jgi:PAS domain S-box-containing protein
LGSLELDIATGTVLGSDTFWDIWGLSRRDSVHISILENIVLAEDKDIRSTPETRTAGSAVPNVEYRIRRPDNGEIRWLSRHIEFVHDENGKPVKMFGIVQDITEQKEARSRQEMLMHELEHRIKNILAMVTAIATQTLKDGDLETVRKNFADRLRALASAHDILNKTRWTAASMAEVIEASIAPLPVARITTRGPDIALQPNMALSMALCLHELGTNALKYGALSVADGRVEINWEIRAGEVGDHETLVWTWSETGGPRVGKPTRKGFGSQLISRVLAADFSGDVEIDYRPSGLQVVLTAPFARQTQ